MADNMSIDKADPTHSHNGNSAIHHGHGHHGLTNHTHNHNLNHSHSLGLNSHHNHNHNHISNGQLSRDQTDSPAASSPDRDQHSANAAAPANPASQEAQQPKRKGGRKPIYATSEERKQRNRQAQAAFRERRTEYIKQLEETIRVHESNLHNLQAAHRTAADECLMLRYKNSLLERILLEKGIDVQAELRAKTGSPNLGPTHMPQNLVQPPPIQRAMMNRHHQSRRSNSNIAPKSEPGVLPPPLQPHSSATSPQNRPTPTSHANSPTNAGSAFSPAPSDSMSMRGSMAPRQPMSQPQQMTPSSQPQRPPIMQSGSRGGPPSTSGASYYPTPAFQSHMDQLEQEYDAQADMMDEPEIETPNGHGQQHGQYPNFSNGEGQHPMMLSPASNGPTPSHEPVPQTQTSHAQYPSMTQLLDQGVDWDPFGLSASMAFPNQQQFQFDHGNMR